MPRLVPIPPQLSARPFTVADAREAGLNVGRLRSADLTSPFYGVRSPRAVSDADFPGLAVDGALLQQCRAFALRMRPGQFFSHITAARLLGAPLPTPFAAGEGLHVSSRTPQRPPRTRGVIGHELKSDGNSSQTRFGLRVADAAEVWLQLAASLPEAEHVALGDYFVLDPFVLDPANPRPCCTLPELTDRLENFRGPGKRAALRALARVRAGAESRPESLLRLLLIDAGLPEPFLNREVRDASGRFLGRVDMIYPEWRVIVEYDGDQHRTSTRQYERDQTRLDALRRAGWTVIQVRSRGLFVNSDTTAARVRRALLEAGWHPTR